MGLLSNGFAGASIFLLTSGALVSCSLTIDPDRQQCSSKSDCTSRGAAFRDTECVQQVCQTVGVPLPVDDGGNLQPEDPAWGCLGKGLLKPTAEPAPYTVSMKLSGVLSGAPYAGIAGKLCKKIDVTCATPVETAETDALGIMTFNAVTANFSGYMAFEGPTNTPGLYFFNPSITKSTETPVAVQVVTPTDVQLLTANALKTPQLEGKGLVLINVANCEQKPAAGVTFKTASVREGSTASYFYALGGVPAQDAVKTDVSGFGGLVNVEAGSVTLEAVVEQEGVEKHVGTISFYIAADSISYMRVVPDAN